MGRTGAQLPPRPLEEARRVGIEDGQNRPANGRHAIEIGGESATDRLGSFATSSGGGGRKWPERINEKNFGTRVRALGGRRRNLGGKIPITTAELAPRVACY